MEQGKEVEVQEMAQGKEVEMAQGNEKQEPESEVIEPADKNILDGNKANSGIYDLSAYADTLENRIQTYSKRVDELTDLNEASAPRISAMEKANSFLRRHLSLFDSIAKLAIAGEDDFKRMLDSISKEPNAIPKLVFYYILLRRKFFEAHDVPSMNKRKRVEAINIEEPNCGNRRSEQCSNVKEEISGQNEVDLLSTDCHVQVDEPSCSNQKHKSNCKVGKQTDGNEAELLDTDERGETCCSNAINNQLAEPANVPSVIDVSDPWIQAELSRLYEEMLSL